MLEAKKHTANNVMAWIDAVFYNMSASYLII